ncbi:MAG: hypothetical protein KF805_12680 [Phycisphaeraceae bacterium]|nr:hypothetical protein [Phycisphaeraceae bacterium]
MSNTFELAKELERLREVERDYLRDYLRGTVLPKCVEALEAVAREASGRAHGFHCQTKSGGECNCSVGLASSALALAKEAANG